MSDLGDRMKEYESRFRSKVFPDLPFAVRVDGRTFSGWTSKHLDTPYDEGFIDLMIEVSEFLLNETQGSVVAYTQSDEISLVFYQPDYQSEPMFNGRVQKLASICASLATWKFNQIGPSYIGSSCFSAPRTFDGRVFGLPSLVESYNYLLWREQDATRNSIQSAGQEYFSHSEMHGKSNNEVQEMLWQRKDINWNNYPPEFKRGSYIVEKTVKEPFSETELEDLPPKHDARQNPNMKIERKVTERLDIPPISQLEDPGEVLFDESFE